MTSELELEQTVKQLIAENDAQSHRCDRCPVKTPCQMTKSKYACKGDEEMRTRVHIVKAKLSANFASGVHSWLSVTIAAVVIILTIMGMQKDGF